MDYASTGEGTISRKRLDRMRSILRILDAADVATVEGLARALSVSQVSLRRDLAHLAEQGLVLRSHGRVRAAGQAEIPVAMRSTGDAASVKRRIALRASTLLQAGPQAIAVSGGTTTLEVVRALRHRQETTVLTNAMSIAVEAAATRLKIIVTGGTLRPTSLEAVGPLAEAAFNTFNVQTAFLGADGVTTRAGVTTHDETEARTNHAMVVHAQRVIVVCDGSKIGRVTMSRMAGLEEVHDLVTDDSADRDEIARISDAGVAVHVVEVSPAPDSRVDRCGRMARSTS